MNYTLMSSINKWSKKKKGDPHLVLGTKPRACLGTVAADEGPMQFEGRSAGIVVEEDGITLCVNRKTRQLSKPGTKPQQIQIL